MTRLVAMLLLVVGTSSAGCSPAGDPPSVALRRATSRAPDQASEGVGIAIVANDAGGDKRPMTAGEKLPEPAGTAGSPGPDAVEAPTSADDAATALQRALERYQNREYRFAIADFMVAIALDPTGPTAPAAHYYLARSQQELEDYATALREYQTFLATYPDQADFADDAQFRIGQCYYRTGDYVKALSELQKVLDDYAGSDAANDAQYTIGRVYLAQANRLHLFSLPEALGPSREEEELLDHARAACQAAIDDYAEREDQTTSVRAQLCIGMTYHVAGDCAAELDAMQKVIDEYQAPTPDPGSNNPVCEADVDHLGACNTDLERWSARGKAQTHIDSLMGVPSPSHHACR